MRLFIVDKNFSKLFIILSTTILTFITDNQLVLSENDCVNYL